MSANHHTAIIGNAKADILKLQNPMKAASKGSIGEPIFAPKINHIELFNERTQAPANARIRSESKLLLCKTLVVQKPVNIELRPVLVCF
jgi:hypothetical protein